MKKDPSVFLFHTQETITSLENFTRGFTFKDFKDDEKTVFAVIRALEIMGEASKNIPKEFRDKHKEIDWKGIAGTRDRLIHHYFGVDLKLTFRIVKQEVPILKRQISKILDDLKIKKLI